MPRERGLLRQGQTAPRVTLPPTPGLGEVTLPQEPPLCPSTGLVPPWPSLTPLAEWTSPEHSRGAGGPDTQSQRALGKHLRVAQSVLSKCLF